MKGMAQLTSDNMESRTVMGDAVWVREGHTNGLLLKLFFSLYFFFFFIISLILRGGVPVSGCAARARERCVPVRGVRDIG